MILIILCVLFLLIGFIIGVIWILCQERQIIKINNATIKMQDKHIEDLFEIITELQGMVDKYFNKYIKAKFGAGE